MSTCWLQFVGPSTSSSSIKRFRNLNVQCLFIQNWTRSPSSVGPTWGENYSMCGPCYYLVTMDGDRLTVISAKSKREFLKWRSELIVGFLLSVKRTLLAFFFWHVALNVYSQSCRACGWTRVIHPDAGIFFWYTKRESNNYKNWSPVPFWEVLCDKYIHIYYHNFKNIVSLDNSYENFKFLDNYN